jgi:hypothetical protein
MAYPIHANHWTLSRAYAFVLERRKGISPNIDFVSELMTFEEELGGKSIGVQPSSGADSTNHNRGPGAGHSHNANYSVTAGGCGGENLPPAFWQTQSFSAVPDNVFTGVEAKATWTSPPTTPPTRCSCAQNTTPS